MSDVSLQVSTGHKQPDEQMHRREDYILKKHNTTHDPLQIQKPPRTKAKEGRKKKRGGTGGKAMNYPSLRSKDRGSGVTRHIPALSLAIGFLTLLSNSRFTIVVSRIILVNRFIE